MKAVALLLCFLVAGAFAQNFVDVLTIDNFEEGFQSLVLQLPAGVTPSNPFIQTDFFSGASNDNILGTERDIEVTVTSGSQGLIVTAQVFPDNDPPQFAIATPQGANAIDLLQYDGADGSINLNINGISAAFRDLTDGGRGIGVTFEALSDLDTSYEFFFYDTTGGVCSTLANIQAGSVFRDFNVPFTAMSGNCDFTDIGAIEMEVDGSANIDSFITFVGIYGTIPPTPSASRAPSVGASPSRTPTPQPLLCHCECPVFTCELIFDVDDDQNDAYYFDDDDARDNANKHWPSSSDASSVAVSVMAVALAAVAFM